ncbi:dihydroneopterin aldolase [Wenxinia marina]|uniref:dihydroneopterin aldolase n=1 Tax=Wenxinia marina DSM 24838 TaxID=1123501 RepID=A0A0D0PCV2_9RHOB|nr:dihydroneopterin aldolase [Wenxinia marina]KIQ69226.1 Dihydroneopterin aldolase [Wenxinia marina DSM 24838]GGL71269.1 diguanylate cyclase [Wenxinia marina]
MTDETRLAFAHPEERAAATAPGPRDRISLRGHVAEAEIGAFEEERGRTQRLQFDVVVEVTGAEAGDEVDAILSYDRIAEAIGHELAARRLDLLETLADNIAARLLAEPQAERVFVRVQKLDRGPGALGVEIVRGAEHRGTAAPEPLPPADVWVLPAGAAEDAALPALVARLAGRPALLLAGAGPAPRAATPEAQTRIDLLALDQAAWLFAAAAPDLVVAASRTEIDWALRRGRPAVWAPSRLVLGAAAPPADVTPSALAAWLAREIGAASIAVVGGPAPVAEVPVHTLDRLGDA